MTGSDSVTFGSLLRRHRLAAGITQAGLAERAELSTDAIAALERGRRVAPRLETVARLATALDLNPTDRAALIGAAVGAPIADAAKPAPADRQSSAVLALPAPPITLLGREHEEVTVRHLLDRARESGAARLISLIGPGGVGKTSLALAVGAAARRTFVDGAVFVDLSALDDPSLVLPALAQALALREAGDQGIRELLIAHLRDRQVLVVLDNAEQVIEAAPSIAEVVAACPRLVVLVTSRVALRVRDEQRFRVPPLALPPARARATVGELADNPAVRLFVARAQAVELDFRLDAANAEAVAAICHRLDGLPLAIELAAARVSLLSPRSLLAQLNQATGALALLKGNARDLPARQRTLRATFEWSIGLLTTAEQHLLRALSVFMAGCTLEAAEAVCRGHAPSEPDASIEDIFEGLASLVDKSLLRAETVSETETRFVMPRTIHDYARELPAASGEQAILEQTHAAYFEALAAAAEPALTGPEQGGWLARLEREHNNLRAALQWTRDAGEPARGVRLAGNLWRFWYTHGYLSEGRAWLEGALEAARGSREAIPDSDTAKAHIGAGVLATMQGDYPRAGAHCEESLRLYRELNDRQGRAVALNILGNLAINQGRYERALELSEESLALQRELGHQRGIALALNNLGFVVLQLGQYSRAEALCQESLDVARALQDNLGMGWALSNLGDAAREQGEYEEALARYAEGIPLCRSMGSTDGVASCLEGIAIVAGAQGHHERAVRLCGAAASLRGTIGAALPSAGRAAYDRALNAACSALGGKEFTAAWESGQALSEEQAVDAGASG
ncbi:MAG TPA: tetratricopeptide repeat protein [Chloroflexota bacterium]|nr:tetratricopeptide repeat protein [Chloroflexota bacterium]